jgi:hypothetical protein
MFFISVNDALDESSLLVLLPLLLEAYPFIEYRLDLSGESDALARHKCVRLELPSLLL